jgi:hypothetical protein
MNSLSCFISTIYYSHTHTHILLFKTWNSTQQKPLQRTKAVMALKVTQEDVE